MGRPRAAGDAGRRRRRLSWLFGILLLAVVIIVVSHLSEARDVARLAEQARPGWLVFGVVCQAATYLFQGQVYRMIAHVDGSTLSVVVAARLSLTKLFVDQAIPSGGLSGTATVATALQRRGMRPDVVAAGIVADFTGNYAAYVFCLMVALVIMTARGHSNVVVLISALVFVLFAIAASVFAITLAGRGEVEAPRRLARFKFVRTALDFIRNANPRVARNPALFVEASVYHLGVQLSDTTTMWVLVRAFGGDAAPAVVFASLMISNLLRQVAFVPGGLGTFEAASVVTLEAGGIPVTLGLAATLVFRGLSFWLPMLPGLWFWRREMVS